MDQFDETGQADPDPLDTAEKLWPIDTLLRHDGAARAEYLLKRDGYGGAR